VTCLGLLAGTGAQLVVNGFRGVDHRTPFIVGGLAITLFSLAIARLIYMRVALASEESSFVGFNKSVWQVLLVVAYLMGIALPMVFMM
jgi:hypothetical protein